MWLFGIFLVILGLVCLAGMGIATRRYGPSGGLPGPGADRRAEQYRMVARGTVVTGAVVLAVNLIVATVT
jgi:drug/metabolite transporter (DMT)-like permease